MDKMYKPREFGALVNRAVVTLQKWDRDGMLVAYRTPTGRRYYTHRQYLDYIGEHSTPKKTVVYCRVSSASQKTDLASQLKAVEQFCAASGRVISNALTDVGSGLNYERKHFLALMEQVEKEEVAEIVIAHKDRLVRFGFEWFEHFCKRHNCTITVMNSQTLSPEQEMTQDLLSIVHCFSSRLYGLRKYKKAIREQVESTDPDILPVMPAKAAN